MDNNTEEFWWQGESDSLALGQDKESLLSALTTSYYVVYQAGQVQLQTKGQLTRHFVPGAQPCLGILPAVNQQKLGDVGFAQRHQVKTSYMAGAMANGISSTDLVIAMGKAGYLAAFGSGGLRLSAIEQALKVLCQALPQGPFAMNLLHNPHNSDEEMAIVDLYVTYGVKTVEASAYILPSLALAYYRIAGLEQGANGEIIAGHHIIAKVSRGEVARRFMAPPEPALIEQLLQQQRITPLQAKLAAQLPLAQDITIEADSGGHTDNRPLVSLLPSMIALSSQLQAQYQYPQAVRIGAAGGISTPEAITGAYAMGAAYVVTGSINQACREAGTSAQVKALLAQAEMPDVMMAPSADMFEQGSKVQVLKKGTMFGLHAQKLYQVYKQYRSVEELPVPVIKQLEQRIFKRSLPEVWQAVQDYFSQQDPRQLQKAAQDSKHKLALMIRWYLGNSSRWAIDHNAERIGDAQIWCGQAMGAFNEWAKGSALAEVNNRYVVDVADALMQGASQHLRLNQLKQMTAELDVAARA